MTTRSVQPGDTVPFLLEANDDVSELLRLQLADKGLDLHRSASVEDAVQHLAACAHGAVLVGGDIAQGAWRWLYCAVPDRARVTLWSSHPEAMIPGPPAGRGITAELLLGMPKMARIVERLLPLPTHTGDESVA